MGLETLDPVVRLLTHKNLTVTEAHMNLASLATIATGVIMQVTLEITISLVVILKKMITATKVGTPPSFVFHMMLSIVCQPEVMPKLENFRINLEPK